MYPTLSYLLDDLFGFTLPFTVKTLELFVVIAFVIAARFLAIELKRKEEAGLMYLVFNKKGDAVQPYQQVRNIIIIAAVFGIIGAKLLPIIQHPSEFTENPLSFLFSVDKFAFYGGFILGAIAVLLYARKVHLKIVHLLDAAAPSLMIAYAIGRLGGHLSGNGSWGLENYSAQPDDFIFLPDWIWAYNYPHNVLHMGVPIKDCVGNFCSVLIHPVYPTPMYEAVFCSVLFFILWKARKKINTGGKLFCLYLVFIGIERFFIEKLRGGVEYSVFGTMAKQSEILSVLFFIIGIAGLLFLRRYYRARNSI